MKKIFFSFAILVTSIATAQVGIGNTDPKATLDVNKASYTTGEQAGIAVTQLTGAQIVAMSTTGLKAGTLVYATSTSGVINETGFWNYNGTTWVKSNNNLYTSDGALTGNRTVAQGTNRLMFSGTGSIGLGYTADPQAKLEIGLSGDATAMDRLAFYSIADNTAGIQTLLDNQNLTGYNYAGSANVLALQPRVGRVGIGVTAPSETFHTVGGVRFQGLGGTGSRMVVADASGVLSTQAIPSGVTVTGTAPINVASGVVSLNDAGVTTAKLADNAVTVSKLPTGATASTFLRGDGTWATPTASTPALAITNPSTDNYTVLESDAIIYRSITAAATITFPASLPAGKVFYIANTSGASDWSLSPAPINTANTFIAAGNALTVVTLGGGNIMVTSGY